MFLSLSRHIEKQLGKRLKKHLFSRISEQKKTNQNIQKSTDNCSLIPVENKDSSFISEQRKNGLNHFLKTRIHLT